MSGDSDLADLGQIMRALRKQRHANWFTENVDYLEQHAQGMVSKVANNGECFVFRNPEYPSVDFYPSTGRWRSEGRTYSGGARAFLRWYASQRKGVVDRGGETTFP